MSKNAFGYLIDNYNLTCNYEEHNSMYTTTTYTNEKTKIIITNDGKYSSYEIANNSEINIDFFNKLFNHIRPSRDGYIEDIINNLIENSQFFEKESTIEINDLLFTETYNYYQGNLTIKINYEPNNNYKLAIMHTNEDYYYFDKELINDIFNEDIRDFDVIKNDNVITYTYKNK